MTTDTQETSRKKSLPLFYKDPVLLRSRDHREAGLAQSAGFGFARDAVAIPLCISEFAVALRHYPIVFAGDDNASPIALVAIKQDHNLFVERDGSWHAGSYIPAYVRRYPFIGTETADKTGQMLCIDRGEGQSDPVCWKECSLQGCGNFFRFDVPHEPFRAGEAVGSIGCLVSVNFDTTTLGTLRTGTALKLKAFADGGSEAPLSISLQGFSTAVDRVTALSR